MENQKRQNTSNSASSVEKLSELFMVKVIWKTSVFRLRSTSTHCTSAYLILFQIVLIENWVA